MVEAGRPGDAPVTDGRPPDDGPPASDTATDVPGADVSDAGQVVADTSNPGSDVAEAPVVTDGPAPDGPAPDVTAAPVKGLIGHWKLDEENSSTMAMDSSGHGHDGTLEGNFGSNPWVAGAKVDGGLRFPSSVQSLAVRTITDAEVMDLKKFTVAAWTLRTFLDSNRQMSVISRQTTGIGEVFNLTFDGPDAVLYVGRVGAGDTPEARWALAEGGLQLLQEWRHLAGTYDGAVLRLYVDGVQRAFYNYAGGLVPSDKPLFIGVNVNDGGSYKPTFDGTLDQVVLYNDALPALSIMQLFQGGPLPSAP